MLWPEQALAGSERQPTALTVRKNSVFRRPESMVFRAFVNFQAGFEGRRVKANSVSGQLLNQFGCAMNRGLAGIGFADKSGRLIIQSVSFVEQGNQSGSFRMGFGA